MNINIILYLALYYISKAISDKIRFKPELAINMFKFVKIVDFLIEIWYNIKIKFSSNKYIFKVNFFNIFVEWLLIHGRFSPSKRNFWTKYIFSFVSDGWHFFDGLRNLAVLLIVVSLLAIPLYWVVIIWALGGILFEIVYNV